jgi:hypothetical protein
VKLREYINQEATWLKALTDLGEIGRNAPPRPDHSPRVTKSVDHHSLVWKQLAFRLRGFDQHEERLRSVALRAKNFQPANPALQMAASHTARSSARCCSMVRSRASMSTVSIMLRWFSISPALRTFRASRLTTG